MDPIGWVVMAGVFLLPLLAAGAGGGIGWLAGARIGAKWRVPVIAMYTAIFLAQFLLPAIGPGFDLARLTQAVQARPTQWFVGVVIFSFFAVFGSALATRCIHDLNGRPRAV